METESIVKKPKRTMRRFFIRTFLLAFLVLTGLGIFFYFGTYERGSMAGKILRISEKGVVFKTFEGKINLETFGALKGVSPIAESFDFSVERKQQGLIRELQEVALRGERINLHYIKRYMKFPWRGDTKYFATSVERLQE